MQPGRRVLAQVLLLELQSLQVPAVASEYAYVMTCSLSTRDIACVCPRVPHADVDVKVLTAHDFGQAVGGSGVLTVLALYYRYDAII